MHGYGETKRVELVGLKKTNRNNNDYLYGGAPIIIIDILAAEVGEVLHKQNAEIIYNRFLVHLDAETRRELGQLLVSAHP